MKHILSMQLLFCFTIQATLIDDLTRQIDLLKQKQDSFIYRRSYELTTILSLAPAALCSLTAEYLPREQQANWFQQASDFLYEWATPLGFGFLLGRGFSSCISKGRNRIDQYIESMEDLRALLSVANRLKSLEKEELVNAFNKSILLTRAHATINGILALKFKGDIAYCDVTRSDLINNLNQRNEEDHRANFIKYELYLPKEVPFGKVGLVLYEDFMELLAEDYYKDRYTSLDLDQDLISDE